MTIENAGLYVWKFLIPKDQPEPLPDCPGVTVDGMAASAIAPSEGEARAHLERFAAENGLDSRWLAVAKSTRIPLINGAVIMWAQV